MSVSLFKKLSVASALALVAVLGVNARAQEVTLKPGDKAPALQVGKWMKGEPVTKFEPGMVYVIECWATWCGPCIQVIPHVTELQKKYEGKVVMIGQNMWERDESKVAPFIAKMGDKMGYRVVMDDKSKDERGAMASTWMEAAGKNGIPCSFIVNQEGNIAWIGHPAEMEAVLEKVVAGKYDLKTEGAGAAKKEEIQKRFNAALQKRDIDGAIKILDEAAKTDAALASKVAPMKFSLLLQAKRYDDAYALNEAVYEAVKDEPQGLNQIAWIVATNPGIEKRDLKFALRLAERAVELTKRNDGQILDTLARVQFDSGDVDGAITTQTEAVAKTPGEGKAEMELSLLKYKNAKK